MTRSDAALAERLREIRIDLYGEEGVATLAVRLRLPPRTWINYEAGVTVPGVILLAFIEETGASPSWLLTGDPPRYARPRRSDLSLVPSEN